MITLLFSFWQVSGGMSFVQTGDTVLLTGAGSARLPMEGQFARGVRFYISGQGKVFLRLLAGNDKGEVFAAVREIELSEKPKQVELALDFDKGNLRLGAIAPMCPTSALYVEAPGPVRVKLWGVETW